MLQADRIANTACHEVGLDSIPALFDDLASRRMKYFRAQFDAVYRKVPVMHSGPVLARLLRRMGAQFMGVSCVSEPVSPCVGAVRVREMGW